MKRFFQILHGRKTGQLLTVGIVCAAVLGATVLGTEKQKTEEEHTSVSAAEIVQKELPVGEAEVELLSELYREMAAGDYIGAATILNEKEKEFDTLMLQGLNGERYGYYEIENADGTVIREMEKLDPYSAFEGMVLTRYNTAFFGEFSKGKPNGTCFAIQTMVLDQPRYSFAEGTWTAGKLNGEGSTGYHYYLNAPASGLIRTEKDGKYKDNLLDGMVSYKTESAGGEKLTWEIRTVNGVTVLTEDWTHYPFRKEYMLGAKEDPGRSYVLSETKLSSVLWNNLIVWE